MKITKKALALTLSASMLLTQASFMAVYGNDETAEEISATAVTEELQPEIVEEDTVETEEADQVTQPVEEQTDSTESDAVATVSDEAASDQTEETATLAASSSSREPILDFESFEAEMNEPDGLATYLNEQAENMYDDWVASKNPNSTYRTRIKEKIDRGAFPTDEFFFGVWDAENEVYTTEGKLNYDFVSPYGYNLYNVEQAVKAGDYQKAKEELLQYYRNVNDAQGNARGTTTAAEKVKNDLLLQRFYIHNSWGAAGIFEMNNGTTDQEFTIDVTDTVESYRGSTVSMIVYAVHKDDYEAVFNSRESGSHAPVIEVNIGGRTRTFNVTADGYVTGGSHASDRSGGTDTSLYAREDGMDVLDEGYLTTDQTRRTYLLFDLSGIGEGDVIESATLKLYGHVEDRAETPRNDSSYSKMMTIATNNATWTESNLSFDNENLLHYAYSYQGDENQTLQTMYWGMPAPSCYPNVRMNQEPLRFSSWWDALARGYSESGNEDYARACITYLYDFIKQTYCIEAGDQGTPARYDSKRSNCQWGQLLFGGYSCTLDASTRASGVAKNFFYIYDSQYLTPEAFTNFLKYFWAMGDLFVEDCWTSSEAGGNWGTAQVNGHMAIYANFPEIVDYDGIVDENGNVIRNSWETAMSEHLYTASGSMMHEDGSSHELSHSYTAYALGTQLTLKDQAEAKLLEFEYDDDVKYRILEMTKYMMRMALPGGYDPQYGDASSHTRSYVEERFGPVGEWLEDPELIWMATGGEQGTKPDYTSYYYPVGKTLAMRSGWDENALFLHVTADAAEGTHSHWDDGGIIVSAYGNYLLADPGYNGYLEDNIPHRWLISSRAHNTVEINDYCQNSNTPNNMDSVLNKGGGEKGDFTTVNFHDTFDFTTVDLTSVYTNLQYRGDPVIAPGGNGTPATEPGMEYKRNILFLKPNFWIVSDYMNPVDQTKENKYSQYWHMTPDANISIDGQHVLQDGETIDWAHSEISEIDQQIPNTQFERGTGNGAFKSNFTNAANVQVVPVDIDSVEPKLCYGYYESSGSAPYGRYDKYATGTTGFDTIIFPTKTGESYTISPTPLEVTGFNTDDHQGAASAFTANIKADQASVNEDYDIYYFILHETDKKDNGADMTFGAYETDGTLAYYEVSKTRAPRQVILQNGTHVANAAQNYELIKSSDTVDNITANWDGSKMIIEGSDDVNLENLTIYAPYTLSEVTFNGESVDFKQAQNYVYFGEEMIEDGSDIVPPVGGGGNGGSGNTGNGNNSGNIHGAGSGTTGIVAQPTAVPTQTPVSPTDALKAELEGHWAENEISTLIDKGIVNGSDGSLKLTENITRAEFTKLILSGIGAEPTEYRGTFNDVSADDWFAGYLQTAADMGIVEGYEGNASPNQAITREEAVKIMMTALATQEEVQYDNTELNFSDSAEISDWAEQYVAKAVELGLINGMEDNTFQPNGNTLREQAMVMTYRVMEELSLISEPTATPAPTSAAGATATPAPTATEEPADNE